MIEIRYMSGEEDSSTAVASVRFNDREELLGNVLLGFIKICCFAGYYTESFDILVKDAIERGLNERYHFEDFLTDLLEERNFFD